MWLLSTDRAELHYFARNLDVIGGYAILSHTWDGDEQTLQQVRAIADRCRANGTNPRDDLELSSKIRECCILVEKQGYRWVWIDSCCIDKTSSSELSEAINSMYQWYKASEVCYAYLVDVPSGCPVHAPNSLFRKSRWHMRGWTLQELIAPDSVIFLSADWRELGNRAELSWLLYTITRVDIKILLGKKRPANYSLSTRMSWASRRKTTRVEDEAYSLMGLFGVSMPTNYGEGKRVFIRLQYKIMQHTSDTSLFAFGYPVSQEDENIIFHPQQEVQLSPWRYLLADSPRELVYGFDYIPDLDGNTRQQYPPQLDAGKADDSTPHGPFDSIELPRMAVTSYGIELRLPIFEVDGVMVAVLLCRRGTHFGLFLTRDAMGKDPKRPRYFTSCPLELSSTTGSAKYVARMVDLGSDLYDLRFSGQRVEPMWRTVYVVPTASNLDSGSATTAPSLSINCNPAWRFRFPRWLVSRFILLEFEVDQVRNTEALQVVRISHRFGTCIFISVGSCPDLSDARKPPRLWAKVDVVSYIDDLQTFDHDCSGDDHLDSESWATRSKDFGDPDRTVRLSFVPSAHMAESTLVIHLELFGSIFRAMLRDTAISIPSLADLERDAPRAIRDVPRIATMPSPAPRRPPSPSSSRSSSLTSGPKPMLHTLLSRILRPISMRGLRMRARDTERKLGLSAEEDQWTM